MPVEIRELVIRTSVEQNHQEQSSTASAATNASSCEAESTANQATNQVAEMSRMLDEKNER